MGGPGEAGLPGPVLAIIGRAAAMQGKGVTAAVA